MEPRLTLENYAMTTHGYIIVCDALAVPGDALSFFPGFGLIGYQVSAASSTIGYIVTTNEHKDGNITKNDMMRAHVDWATGFIPFWGIIPAGLQLNRDCR